MSTTQSTRRRSERGTVLVELVMVLPLILLVAVGIMEFSHAWNDKIELNQAVREGARLGARADFFACGGAGSNTGRIECLTAERISGGAEADSTLGVWVNAPAAPTVGKELTVCAEVTVSATTPIISAFIDGKKLRSEATMRIEREDDSDYLTDSAGLPGWCGP